MTDLEQTIARWNLEDAEDVLQDERSALRRAYYDLRDVSPDATKAILRAYHATSKAARLVVKKRVALYRRILGFPEESR